MNTIFNLYKSCKISGTGFFNLLIKSVYYKVIKGKNIRAGNRVFIKGLKNILTRGRVTIGLTDAGFSHRTDSTFLNIRGSLEFKGDFSVGRGCRLDVGPNGKITIGKNGYITANSYLIISHNLVIGDNCAISWDCQFLDEDFHSISYEGKKNTRNDIIIGNNVWIGSGVKIYKGTQIPDGCVIAANSVVKATFEKQNLLIGGNPARVIKEDVSWN